MNIAPAETTIINNTKIIAYGFSIESLLYRLQEYAKYANTEYKYKKKPLARLITKKGWTFYHSV